MAVTARVTSKGQITIPKEIRERLGITTGDSLEFEFTDEKTLEVRPVKRRSITEFRGLFRVPPHLAGLPWEEVRERAWRESTRRLVAPEDE